MRGTFQIIGPASGVPPIRWIPHCFPVRVWLQTLHTVRTLMHGHFTATSACERRPVRDARFLANFRKKCAALSSSKTGSGRRYEPPVGPHSLLSGKWTRSSNQFNIAIDGRVLAEGLRKQKLLEWVVSEEG